MFTTAAQKHPDKPVLQFDAGTAAYKAGQSSNAAEVDASADRAKIDDKVGGESDAAVDRELQRWNRKS